MSLNSIKTLMIVMEMQHVFCGAGTEVLNIILENLTFQSVKRKNRLKLSTMVVLSEQLCTWILSLNLTTMN
jgi:hypothetical protein